MDTSMMYDFTKPDQVRAEKCSKEAHIIPRTKRPRSQPLNIRTALKDMHAMAELFVGPQAVRFLVHRDLLVHHSSFFSAALTGAFAEGLSQSVNLPEESLDTFELFLFWLYTQQLDAKAYFKDAKPAYYVLLHLYALADRLGIEQLRNLTVDTIAFLADQTNSVLTPSDTFILYEQIRDSAPLRRLILDLFAFKKTDKLLDEHPDTWHPGFMRDLVVKLKRPDEVAMQRHTLCPWKPDHWQASKGCSMCSEVLQPVGNFSACTGCGKKFCSRCAKTTKALCAFEEGREMCKPWKREVKCTNYHEHAETAPC